MNGTELINYVISNPMAVSTVNAIITAVLATIFLRSNTSKIEFEKVKAGKFEEVIEELVKSGEMTLSELYKTKNFLSIAKRADDFYSKTHQSENPKDYNFDWFIRFYEAAGNISNESMQELWAKILAGEIRNPSSYSLRTLDVLKNLTQNDGELFEKVCRYSIKTGNSIFLPFYQSYRKKFGIEYSEIMHLNELGLIFSDGQLVLKINTNKNKKNVFMINELVLVHSSLDDTKNLFEIKQFPFTKAGIEIASLNSNVTLVEHTIEFVKELKEDNTSIQFGLHRLVSYNHYNIEYETVSLI